MQHWRDRLRRLIGNLVSDTGGASPRTLPSVEAYALWAESYPPQPHNRLMEIEQAAMLPWLQTLDLARPGCRVLDLACGTGRYSLLARQLGAQQVISFDNSPAMLRQSALAETGAAACASMVAIPLAGDSIDMVICGLATGHLPPQAMRTAINEIGRVLRPGGVALISDFHPYVYLSGGRRTFRAADGNSYMVEHYPHLVADYFDACREAGLAVDMIREPVHTVARREVPAVLALRCVKND